jgi:hypothetical protein
MCQGTDLFIQYNTLLYDLNIQFISYRLERSTDYKIIGLSCTTLMVPCTLFVRVTVLTKPTFGTLPFRKPYQYGW